MATIFADDGFILMMSTVNGRMKELKQLPTEDALNIFSTIIANNSDSVEMSGFHTIDKTSGGLIRQFTVKWKEFGDDAEITFEWMRPVKL